MKINNSKFFNNKTNYIEPLSFFVWKIKNKLKKNTYQKFFRYKKINQELKQHIIYYEKIVLNSSHKSISQRMTERIIYKNYVSINNTAINLNQQTYNNYIKIYNFCKVTNNFEPLFKIEEMIYNIFVKEYKNNSTDKNKLFFGDIKNILIELSK